MHQPKNDSPANPYAMAVFTAALAGVFSIIGSYFGAGFQAHSAVMARQVEMRAEAYAAFFGRIDPQSSPQLSRLLNLGAAAEHLATDAVIQEFEAELADILHKANLQELHWQLNANLNVLRIHGSLPVNRMCDDLLRALILRDEEIDWTAYPDSLQAAHKAWKSEGRNTLGWEPRVRDDQRLMIVSVAMLMRALVNQMQIEIGSPKQ
jgi:hypothetical protein